MEGSLCCFVCFLLRHITLSPGFSLFCTGTLAIWWSCSLHFAHTSQIRATKEPGNISGRLGAVMIFGIYTLTCDVANAHQCLKLVYDTMEYALAIHAGDMGVCACRSSLLLPLYFPTSFVAFLEHVEFVTWFLLRAFSILFLNDECDLWSDTYDSVRFQSTEAEFQVALVELTLDAGCCYSSCSTNT